MAGPRIAAGGTLVLDAAAVTELAAGDARIRGHVEVARERRARVVISAVTLAEVSRSSTDSASLDAVLTRLTVLPVTPEIARLAGKRTPSDELGGRDESTVDAIVAATALRLAHPVVLLTAVPEAMGRLLADLAEFEEVPTAGGVSAEDGGVADSPPHEEITPRGAAKSGEFESAAESPVAAASCAARSARRERSTEQGALQAAEVQEGVEIPAFGHGDGGGRGVGRRRVFVARA